MDVVGVHCPWATGGLPDHCFSGSRLPGPLKWLHVRTFSTLGLCLPVSSGVSRGRPALLAAPPAVPAAPHPDYQDKPKRHSRFQKHLPPRAPGSLQTQAGAPAFPRPDTAVIPMKQGHQQLPHVACTAALRPSVSAPRPPWAELLKVPEPPLSPLWAGASLTFPQCTSEGAHTG